jgi:hypothetical protein
MNIFKIFRPELSDYTLRQYNKELAIMRDNFGETDEYDLLFNIIDVSKEELKLDYLFLGTEKKYQKNVRLAIFRNLMDIFKNEIDDKTYEIMDLLILEERFK